jgi:hypothetical protein
MMSDFHLFCKPKVDSLRGFDASNSTLWTFGIGIFIVTGFIFLLVVAFNRGASEC